MQRFRSSNQLRCTNSVVRTPLYELRCSSYVGNVPNGHKNGIPNDHTNNASNEHTNTDPNDHTKKGNYRQLITLSTHAHRQRHIVDCSARISRRRGCSGRHAGSCWSKVHGAQSQTKKTTCTHGDACGNSCVRCAKAFATSTRRARLWVQVEVVCRGFWGEMVHWICDFA
jgi:hypothetical protein